MWFSMLYIIKCRQLKLMNSLWEIYIHIEYAVFISWNNFLRVELLLSNMLSVCCQYVVTNSMLLICCYKTVCCQYVFSILLIFCQYVVTDSMLSVVGLPPWRSRFVVHQSVDGFCSGWGCLSFFGLHGCSIFCNFTSISSHHVILIQS